jgi:mercuric ion transport protein
MSELSSSGRESSVSWLALFASTGTLVCCALPILLVSLGMGATMAALTSNFPFLVTLSEHKLWVFSISGSLLAFGAWSLWRPGRACPIEPSLAAKCEQATRWNRRILVGSAVVWAVGFFAAYLSLPIYIWVNS